MFGSDPEYRALPPDQKLVWITLIGGEIPKACGICKDAYKSLLDQTTLPHDDVMAALVHFESLGWIVILDNWLWIKNYLDRHDHIPNQQLEGGAPLLGHGYVQLQSHH